MPKYRRLHRELTEDIISGKYAKGSQMPSQQELARSFDVSLLTVREALQLLQKDGIISMQHGKGTFVRQIPSRFPCQRNATKNRIAYVMAGKVSDVTAYLREELEIAEELLAQKGYQLSICSLKSADIIQGNLPPALNDEALAGVLIDNLVNDSHIEFLNYHQIPFVVLGSCDFSASVPNVRHDMEKSGYLLGNALQKNSEGPVYLVTTPFTYHYIHDLYKGFARSAAEFDQAGRIRTVYEADKDSLKRMVFEDIAKEAGPSFSLFLHLDAAHIWLDFLNDTARAFEDHPTVIFGQASHISPRYKRLFNNCTISIRQTIKTAIDTLEQVIAGKQMESVVFSPVVDVKKESDILQVDLEWRLETSMEHTEGSVQ